MKKELNLSIPKPCHEKWNSFTKTTQGGFCGNCQKEVVDFTTWNEERIQSFFKSRPMHTCGRFRQEQLKVYTLTPPSRTGVRALLAMMVVTIITLFTSRQGFTQTKPVVPTEQYQPEDIKIGKIKAKPVDRIQITGVVKSAEDSSALPGVNIVYQNTLQSTVTDENGAFSLYIENPSGKDSLVFSFIGLQSKVYVVNSTQRIQNINVAMELDVTQLGEMVIVGGVVGIRWLNPRRWWWGIKGLWR